ncbi:hypothetical protein MATL_G00055950 [Megalops atlanticus]|uniref:Uncharacterized protein n=1 Tax=Megalops atlanticus TaxID=7932 RepID=A0A9D3Q7B0_MEGAT|nr:hypothetical protein MATL_G00055950 [Megalops atlanticus]
MLKTEETPVISAWGPTCTRSWTDFQTRPLLIATGEYIAVPIRHPNRCLQVGFSLSEPGMSEAETRVCVGGQDESAVFLPHRPHSWVKRCLRRLRSLTAVNRDREADSPPLHRQRLLLVGCVLLALTAMALLLAWNYQCIIVERLCEGQEERSAFPLIGALTERWQEEAAATRSPDARG